MTLSIVMQAPLDRIPRGMRLYVFDDQANSWPMVHSWRALPMGSQQRGLRRCTRRTFRAWRRSPSRAILRA